MKKPLKLATLGLVLVAAAIAFAEFVADDWFGFDVAKTIEIGKTYLDDGAPPSGINGRVRVYRSAIDGDGNMTLQAEYWIASSTRVTAMVLQVADDTNANGILDNSEWQTIAIGIDQSAPPGEKLLLTPTVPATNAHGGYRVLVTRANGKTEADVWGNDAGLSLPAQ